MSVLTARHPYPTTRERGAMRRRLAHILRRLADSPLDSPVLRALPGATSAHTPSARAHADRPHAHWHTVTDATGRRRLEATWQAERVGVAGAGAGSGSASASGSTSASATATAPASGASSAPAAGSPSGSVSAPVPGSRPSSAPVPGSRPSSASAPAVGSAAGSAPPSRPSSASAPAFDPASASASGSAPASGPTSEVATVPGAEADVRPASGRDQATAHLRLTLAVDDLDRLVDQLSREPGVRDVRWHVHPAPHPYGRHAEQARRPTHARRTRA
ncbi:hypothetical protein [Embleya sp. AB8]|uniref:hypothetical protein n=1 Tax=Embleya sp. AB8 TaxID=3156304 RepID=UPI003C742163